MANSRLSLKGVTMNHKSADRSNDTNQKKALVIRTITLTGSLAIVSTNIEMGGPKAKNKQPKNSTSAILLFLLLVLIYLKYEKRI